MENNQYSDHLKTDLPIMNNLGGLLQQHPYAVQVTQID
jgi:hypothetical protein